MTTFNVTIPQSRDIHIFAHKYELTNAQKHAQTHCKRSSTRQLLGMTHLWMIFDGDVDLLCVDDGRTVAVRQDERLLDVAVDLEQVASHLADL